VDVDKVMKALLKVLHFCMPNLCAQRQLLLLHWPCCAQKVAKPLFEQQIASGAPMLTMAKEHAAEYLLELSELEVWNETLAKEHVTGDQVRTCTLQLTAQPSSKRCEQAVAGGHFLGKDRLF
jgi:hypothetical protein